VTSVKMQTLFMKPSRRTQPPSSGMSGLNRDRTRRSDFVGNAERRR